MWSGRWVSLKNIGTDSISLVFIFSAPGFEENMRVGQCRPGSLRHPSPPMNSETALIKVMSSMRRSQRQQRNSSVAPQPARTRISRRCCIFSTSLMNGYVTANLDDGCYSALGVRPCFSSLGSLQCPQPESGGSPFPNAVTWCTALVADADKNFTTA